MLCFKVERGDPFKLPPRWPSTLPASCGSRVRSSSFPQGRGGEGRAAACAPGAKADEPARLMCARTQP